MISGFSHVRYDHRSRPTLIEVACPQCGSKCAARKNSEIELGKISGDLSGTWNLCDWVYFCPQCIKRKENLSYDALPDYYYRDGSFWAWNHEHLNSIESYLKGELDPENDYSWFMTYLQKDWLKERSTILKKIERMREL